MIQTLSMKDARNKLADIVSRVEMTGDEIIITKFGKPRVMIVAFNNTKVSSRIPEAAFGIWKDRKEMKDSAKWVRELRTKMSLRLR